MGQQVLIKEERDAATIPEPLPGPKPAQSTTDSVIRPPGEALVSMGTRLDGQGKFNEALDTDSPGELLLTNDSNINYSMPAPQAVSVDQCGPVVHPPVALHISPEFARLLEHDTDLRDG